MERSRVRGQNTDHQIGEAIPSLLKSYDTLNVSRIPGTRLQESIAEKFSFGFANIRANIKFTEPCQNFPYKFVCTNQINDFRFYLSKHKFD